MGHISPMSFSEHTRLHPQHERWADALLRETRAHAGLAPVDLDRFWADQTEARRDAFSPACPQLPLGIMMSWECVFDELGVPADHWRFINDHAWALSLKKAYNDKAARGVAFSTAGSINNSSRLTGLRLLMAGIQRHCRFG